MLVLRRKVMLGSGTGAGISLRLAAVGYSAWISA